MNKTTDDDTGSPDTVTASLTRKLTRKLAVTRNLAN